MPKIRQQDGTFIDVPLDALYDDDGQNPFVAPAPQAPGPGDQFFTAADIEKARQEEKDKLYTRLENLGKTVETLESKLTPLTQAEEQRLAAAKAEEDRLEAEARAAQQAELSPQELVEQARQEWEARLNETNAALQASEAAREKERLFNEVRDYINEQIAVHTNPETGDVAPEFVQYITGNSKEEVDASIERAKASTQSIIEQFQSLNQQIDPTTGEPFQQQVPVVDPNAVVIGQQAPGVQAPPSFAGSRAWGTPAVDIAGQQTQTLTAQQIKDMPLSEYEKYRSRLGVAPKGQNHGLFG